MGSVLVVDDQEHVLDALELLFRLRKIPVVRAGGPEQALAAVRQGDIDVVIQDMNFTEATTSGDEGVALFRAIRAIDPALPVILMTAWSSLKTAITLVKEGADDYLEKPWNDETLVRKVRNLRQARAGAPVAGIDVCGLVFSSAAMQAVVSLAGKVAPSDAPVLITGPNGSGKEKIAEIVHANSRRNGAPFFKVNVGALPNELFSAELFGAEVGAFTGARQKRVGRFEAADTGTLFLDELGTLGLDNQAMLLRALQSGEFQRLGSNITRTADVRVIAATNIDMKRAIASGEFRDDLYYRLAVIEIEVPALRDRREDIRPLAELFLRSFAGEQGQARALSPDALAALERHDWPGNVRELQNCIRRAVLIGGPTIQPEHLKLGAKAGRDAAAGTPERSEVPAVAESRPNDPDELTALERAEFETIERALRDAGFVVSKAARALGVSRQTLYRRMQRLSVKVARKISR